MLMLRGSRVRCRAACAAAALLLPAPAPADPDSLHVGPTAPDGLIASWTGGPYTAANPSSNFESEPDCALVPNSCDDMLLTIDLPAGYVIANPTHQLRVSVNWTPATQGQDVDVFFQDPNTGVSVHTPSATAGRPEVAFLPLQDGVTTIRVRLLMFTAVNLSFTGTVDIGSDPVEIPGTGTYAASTDLWSCNRHLLGPADFVGGTAFDHSNDAEPAVKFDANGRSYIAAIAGVPAGAGLWTTQDDCGQAYEFLGAVDRGTGGGDADVETATAPNLLGDYNVYVSSLTMANISMAMSCDGGNTFTVTPISTPFPINDRQWNAAHGSSICYLSYRQGLTSPGNFLECVRLTYADCVTQPLASSASLVWDNVGANPPAWPRQLGNMATDRRDHANNALLQAGPDGEGAVYHGYTQENTPAGLSQVWVAASHDFATTSPWNNVLVWEGPAGPTYDHIFTWVSVDADGNVWTTFSDDANVYYSVSTNQGVTWSHAVRVNRGGPSRTSIFPHVVAGAGGTAVFTYYGHAGTGSQDPFADWDVFVSTTRNGLDAFTWATTPVLFEEALISDRAFHAGPICQGGLACVCCQQLLECYDIDINPVDGRAMVAYGSTASGTWISNQLSGTNNLDGTPLQNLGFSCPNPENLCISEACSLLPSCECPGCSVVSDPDALDVPPVPIPALNLREVTVAEPHLASADPVGGDVIVFGLTVESLDPQNLPPNAIWQVIFSGAAGTQYFVRLINCPTSGVLAEYGHLDLGTVVDGALPHYAMGADGRICMWISRSLVGNPLPPELLTVTGYTRELIGACPGSPGAFPQVDVTNSGQYVVVGNQSQFCSPIGLEVSGFSARPFGGGVEVSWISTGPDRFRALRVERAGAIDGPWAAVHEVAPRRGEQRFLDRPGAGGDFFYRLLGVDRSGAAVELALTMLTRDTVRAFDLLLAGPNPFRERTVLTYALPVASHVHVDVYNVAGRLVRTLVDGERPPGAHALLLDGHAGRSGALGAGVYLVRIRAGDFRKTLRVVALD